MISVSLISLVPKALAPRSGRIFLEVFFLWKKLRGVLGVEPLEVVVGQSPTWDVRGTSP